MIILFGEKEFISIETTSISTKSGKRSNNQRYIVTTVEKHY